MDLSQYVVEALRRDEEFVLYRGTQSNHSGLPSILLLSPASMQTGLETLRKIEHEYSLRDELDFGDSKLTIDTSDYLLRAPATNATESHEQAGFVR